MGNQLFQYAFFRALQRTFSNVKADLSGYGTYGLHNGFELNRVFGIDLPLLTPFEHKLFDWEDRRWTQRKLRRILGTKNAYYEEKTLFCYDSSVFKTHKHRYYWGYWQNIRYIDPVAESLRTELRFPAFSNPQNVELARKLAVGDAVSVHVRRGDYLVDPLLGGICDTEYYNRALAYMQRQVKSPHFIFFSDDVAWCRKTFPQIDAVFVDWNTDLESFRDMQLMSLCKHHIIANSSFSWWGAWFNTYSHKIVVSPRRWVTTDGLDFSGIMLSSFHGC